MMIPSYNTVDSFTPSIHQPEPPQMAVQQPAPQPVEQNNLDSSIPFCSYVRPPFFHSPDVTVSVCCVDQMNVDQTANWIRTLGVYKGWEEGDAYSESFRKQNMTGELLQHLTPKMLELSLGITNHAHRQELMYTIQQLFPTLLAANTNVAAVQRTSVTGLEILESWYGSSHGQTLESESESANPSAPVSTCAYNTGERPVEFDCESRLVSISSIESAQMVCSDMMSESGYSKWSRGESFIENDYHVEDDRVSVPLASVRNPPQETIPGKNKDVLMSDKPVTEVSHLGNAVCVQKTSPARDQKLLLIIPPDQMCNDLYQIKCIRSRFAELNFVVEVQPIEDKPNLFTIVFPNRMKAQEAHTQSSVIGYNLLKKRSPRPKPYRPVKFRTVKSLLIRTGKALSGDIVGRLQKNEVVTVNQIKGRRARLIKETENGEAITIGWVSLHSTDGIPFLRRFRDI